MATHLLQLFQQHNSAGKCTSVGSPVFSMVDLRRRHQAVEIGFATPELPSPILAKRGNSALKKATQIVACALSMTGVLSAQPQQVRADEYTRHELLPPE